MDARERLEVEGEDERQKRLGPGLLHDHLDMVTLTCPQVNSL